MIWLANLVVQNGNLLLRFNRLLMDDQKENFQITILITELIIKEKKWNWIFKTCYTIRKKHVISKTYSTYIMIKILDIILLKWSIWWIWTF